MLQSYNADLYRKVVKLIKYWNSVRLSGIFSSYYIELALSRAFWKRKGNNQPIASLSEGLTIGFEVLEATYKAGDQTPWISDAPLVLKPSLSELQAVRLSLAQITASIAWINEQSGRETDALKQWSDVFGEDL